MESQRGHGAKGSWSVVAGRQCGHLGSTFSSVNSPPPRPTTSLICTGTSLRVSFMAQLASTHFELSDLVCDWPARRLQRHHSKSSKRTQRRRSHLENAIPFTISSRFKAEAVAVVVVVVRRCIARCLCGAGLGCKFSHGLSLGQPF